VTLDSVGSTPGQTHNETVTVNVGGAHSVGLNVNVHGAVLQVQPTQLGGYLPNQTQTFNVTNTGDSFVYVAHQSTDSIYSVSPSKSQLYWLNSGANSNTIQVKLTASNDAGAHSADINTVRIDTPLLEQLIYPESAHVCNGSTFTVKATTN
jgi:hypothetical protein